MKTVKICWNHAKIVPAAVVATGPEESVLNDSELAALLLQLQRPAPSLAQGQGYRDHMLADISVFVDWFCILNCSSAISVLVLRLDWSCCPLLRCFKLTRSRRRQSPSVQRLGCGRVGLFMGKLCAFFFHFRIIRVI